jgi:hypothetical protein
MPSLLPLLIESIVAILLAVTVAYCIMLDQRLKRLRADEQSMRQTVVDLGLATERAERAIDALRGTLSTFDQTLSERLRTAEAKSGDLLEQIRSGDEVLDRIVQVVSVARKAMDAPVADEKPAAVEPPSAMSETVAMAEAFAERARRRVMTQAQDDTSMTSLGRAA